MSDKGEPEWLEEAQALRAKGLGAIRISKRLNASARQVSYWLYERHQGEPRECKRCGRLFRPTKLKHVRGEYCSQRCHLLDTRQGKKNPAYKDGKRVGERAISKVFNLKLKGEDSCRACGRPAFDAHHAVPRSLAPAARRDLRNCLPLCHGCHSAWHRGRAIPRRVFRPEEWAYISSLIGPDWLDKRYPAEEVDG